VTVSPREHVGPRYGQRVQQQAVSRTAADRRVRLNRADGRDAYVRAAREQRVFAGHAALDQEKAARLAVADRIEAKARV
jgi:hypothetical protein